MALISDPTLDSRVITKSYINNLKTKIMEKKEELLERLVNGIELQNKLLAMQLAKEVGIYGFNMIEEEEKRISTLEERADILLKRSYLKR